MSHTASVDAAPAFSSLTRQSLQRAIWRWHFYAGLLCVPFMMLLANQLVMLATCLAIILACVSGVVMWWKRRPSGRVGVPPYPSDPRVYRGLWIVAIAVGLAFPITGLAILIMVAFDVLVIRTIPPLRRVFA